MAHELIGEDGGVVEDFDDIDGKGGDLCEHHPPQRVRSLEVEVLDDEVGALVVRLHITASASISRSRAETTKRAVYLKEAHVDLAALGIVVHRVLMLRARGLCGREFARRA